MLLLQIDSTSVVLTPEQSHELATRLAYPLVATQVAITGASSDALAVALCHIRPTLTFNADQSGYVVMTVITLYQQEKAGFHNSCTSSHKNKNKKGSNVHKICGMVLSSLALAVGFMFLGSPATRQHQQNNKQGWTFK